MKTLLSIIIIVVVLVLGYIFLLAPQDDGGEVVDTNEEVSSLDTAQISGEVASGEAVLLDVRTDEELSSDGYAKDSTHFDLARLEAGELPDIEKGTTIYAYCKGGTRAGKAEVILEDAGYVNVINIGGLVDWEAAGGEVVK